jgi:hypothetical protein
LELKKVSAETFLSLSFYLLDENIDLKEEIIMMYPYMTLNDDTEITHSEMKADGRVKVYIETPDERVCFRYATCWLPEYKWEDVYAYSDAEMDFFKRIIRNNAHLIIEFSQEGGITNAANF